MASYKEKLIWFLDLLSKPKQENKEQCLSHLNTAAIARLLEMRLLTTPPRCHFLMCTHPIRSSLMSQRVAEPISSPPPFFLLQKSLYSGGLQLSSPPLGLKTYF